MPRTSTCVAALALTLGALTPSAHAQSSESDDVLQIIKNDLTTLSINLPVWLADHLPAVMGPVGLGAGSGIKDDSGAFTFGIVTRVGVFNNFDDLGYGLKIVDLQSELPSLVPWPQFGVVVGGSLGHGFEVGADVQFIPDTDIAGDHVTLSVGLIAAAVSARVRVNKADGAIPALLFGLGASYYSGRFAVGTGFSSAYSETVDGETVEGHYTVETAPAVTWSLFQLSPEVRLAWDIGGVFRPYLGVGLGLTFGAVSDRVHLRATATVEKVNGTPRSEAPVVYDQDVASFDTPPATYALRPHVGFDILLGPVALTVQADLAVMGKDQIDSSVAEAAASFDSSDGHYLYNQNARSSVTQSAFVGTVALRVQF